MLQVADALGWFHRGIIGRTHTNRVHFAHMDLKPNNILIDADGTSAVGKWVLTDFGISAFKEDNEAVFPNVLSIRDLYENLTIKETPRRPPGAYQPPEIQRIRDRASEIGNDTYQGVAGRKGDIWSFGCILSEVFTFALGQTLAVQTFRTVRKSQGDDYFYEAEPTELLDVQHQPASYRVRSKVKEWLRKLPEQYSFPNRAIDCCVQTILDILVVDGVRRPKADDLVRKMEHVVHHLRTARRPGDLPYCPLKGRPANDAFPTIELVQTESSLKSVELGPREAVVREARSNLHGVIIRPDRQRVVGTPISKAKITSTSLCPSGHGIAFLATQPKATHQSVYVCKISTNDRRLELDGPSSRLPLGPEWKRIVHAGNVFVTWGNAHGGGKHVS
jgi:serine/threonine protein kinase